MSSNSQTKEITVQDLLPYSQAFSPQQKSFLLDNWPIIPSSQKAKLIEILQRENKVQQQQDKLVKAEINKAYAQANAEIKAISSQAQRKAVELKEQKQTSSSEAEESLNKALNDLL